MDVSCSCVVSVSNSVDGPYDLKQSHANQKQWCNTSKINTEESVMEKLGNALGRILHVHDDQLLLSGCVSLSVVDKLSDEFNVDQSKLLIATTQENSHKCLPYPCFETEPSNIFSVDKKSEVPDISLDTESNMYLEDRVSKHPTPLSAPIKLVSAMKGSREKQGIPLQKLSVSWDPDVYDPPVTSLSHTVTSHRQHSRYKKNSKHKHKGKSSQGSNNGKRYPKHVGKSDLRSKSSERTLFGGYNRSTLKLTDFTVIDSKCGSSFLGTSLAKVNIPVTEAA